MFKELVEKGYYCFHDGFDSWEEAVKASCEPLLRSGAIEDVYVSEIIAKVKELGPYIVIAPNIAIPHAQEGLGVHETAVSFMKTEKPVHFSDSPDHDAQLFFVLASTDNEKHLQNLMDLSEYLSEEDNVNRLLQVSSEEEFKALF